MLGSENLDWRADGCVVVDRAFVFLCLDVLWWIERSCFYVCACLGRRRIAHRHTLLDERPLALPPQHLQFLSSTSFTEYPRTRHGGEVDGQS